MSTLETLQEHIAAYNGMLIMTDFPGKQSGYALQPTGNDKTREDVLGNKVYTNNYVFWVKEIARDEVDRKDNQDFLEAFALWLDEQPLPKLPGRFTALSLSVANCMLMDINEDGTGIYQVQIRLEIKKGVS